MKRRVTWAFAALALVSPLAVTAASAQTTIFNYTNFWAQCTPGLLVACSSAEIWNEVVHETGEIYLGVRVSNLQGTPGFRELGQAGLSTLTINNVRFAPAFPATEIHIDTSLGGDASVGYLSGATSQCNTFGQCTDVGVGDIPFFIPVGDNLWRMVIHIGSSGQYLWGCDPDHPTPSYMAPSTCGGYLSWRLRPTDDRHPSEHYALLPTQETSLFFGYIGGRGEPSRSASCTTGVDCITVTPEPATILLLAGGLLGIGFVTVRRGRRTTTSAIPDSRAAVQ